MIFLDDYSFFPYKRALSLRKTTATSTSSSKHDPAKSSGTGFSPDVGDGGSGGGNEEMTEMLSMITGAIKKIQEDQEKMAKQLNTMTQGTQRAAMVARGLGRPVRAGGKRTFKSAAQAIMAISRFSKGGKAKADTTEKKNAQAQAKAGSKQLGSIAESGDKTWPWKDRGCLRGCTNPEKGIHHAKCPNNSVRAAQEETDRAAAAQLEAETLREKQRLQLEAETANAALTRDADEARALAAQAETDRGAAKSPVAAQAATVTFSGSPPQSPQGLAAPAGQHYYPDGAGGASPPTAEAYVDPVPLPPGSPAPPAAAAAARGGGGGGGGQDLYDEALNWNMGV